MGQPHLLTADGLQEQSHVKIEKNDNDRAY